MARIPKIAGSAAVAVLSAPILAYRYLISPMMPPRCRFAPSCSAYALEALRRHGAINGSWLALKRLARCHPIAFLGGSSGYDPVPRHTHSKR
jgi:putative membrane protein insertion efficiency factor